MQNSGGPGANIFPKVSQNSENHKNNSVEQITQEILTLLEDQKLSESEKGEVVLKVLRKIMNFKDKKGEKFA